MLTRSSILLVASLAIKGIMHAQTPDPPEWAFCPSIASQGRTFGELDIMRAQLMEGHGVDVLYGPFAGIGSTIDAGERILVPKIGYELAMTLITVRLSTAYYCADRTNDLRFLPEVGLTFFGLADLTYGWTIPLNNDPIPGLTIHRLALTVNLHRGAWGACGIRLPLGKKDDSP